MAFDSVSPFLCIYFVLCVYVYLKIFSVLGYELGFTIIVFIYSFTVYLHDLPTGAGINPQSTAPITGSRILGVGYG